MGTATDSEFVARVRDERNALLVERERLFRLAHAIETRAKRVDSRLNDCVSAARLFDVTLALPDWGNVFKTSLEEEMTKRMSPGNNWVRPEPYIANDDEEFLKDILEETIDTDDSESRPSNMPTVKDIVLDRLMAAAEQGSKASTIREYIETTYAAQIHVKTVGMTLYRLVKDGLARRDGRTWFYVPPSAEAENPGASGSGAD